jgi:hypothetical protein
MDAYVCGAQISLICFGKKMGDCENEEVYGENYLDPHLDLEEHCIGVILLI